MTNDVPGTVEPPEADVQKADIPLLLTTFILPVFILLLSAWVMIDKSYWAGMGFFAVGIVFWFLIYCLQKYFFQTAGEDI